MPIPQPLSQSLRSALRQPSTLTFTGRGVRQQPCRWLSQRAQSRGQPQQSSQSTATEDAKETEASVTGSGKIEGLPAPGEGVKLDVSGEGSSVSLGHLGPLVVNRDGTTGRVSNWDSMTVHEKETTLALLKKRNKARLDVLKKDEEDKA